MTLVPNASERPGQFEIAHHVVTERQELAFRRSVISIDDGAWVMQSGGLAFFTASCGVRPQAQNTGNSSSATSGSPTF